jgi:methionine-rich copper-binding protein CopC
MRLLQFLRRLLQFLRGLLQLQLRLLTSPRELCSGGGSGRFRRSIRWRGLPHRTEKIMTFPARRLGPLTALAALLVFQLLLAASPASAHTSLTGSDPADGAETAAPEKVTLTFSEPVRSARVVVRSEDSGAEVHRGAAKLDGARVVQRVKGGQPAGKYTIGYRVISADGHPVAGTLSFTVTGASAAPTDGTAETGTPATARPTDTSETGETAEGGATRWIMVGAGLAAGAGIGMLFTMRRRK